MRKDGMTMRQRAQQVRHEIMTEFGATNVEIAWNQNQIPNEMGFELPGTHAIAFLVTLKTDAGDSMTVAVPVSKKAMMLEGNETGLMVSIGRYLLGLVDHRRAWLQKAASRKEFKK